MIAALYVATGGCYFGLPDVDPWDEERDARTYDGPYPVVAHPPCARWSAFWFGGPLWIAKGNAPKVLGDDGGCFEASLSAVRRFGGVLEHPANTKAWARFGINKPPQRGGWIPASLFDGGWTCHVEQGHYGHRARKATWLLVHGAEPPEMRWGPSDAHAKWSAESSTRALARIKKDGACMMLSHKERAATPLPFRDLLLNIARSTK